MTSAGGSGGTIMRTTPPRSPVTRYHSGWPTQGRQAMLLGRPKEHGTFHALRHFFATTLITNAEPQEVQRLLRHKTLRITLETYTGGRSGSVRRAWSARCYGLPETGRQVPG